MRTVTFSNAEVAKVINDNFIATWVNRQPGFHNCDDHAEKRIEKYDYECFATRNFCTFFASPDQDVLHYGSGHQYPVLFLKEVSFVLELAPAVLDRRNRYMEDALPEFRALHAAHADHHHKERDRLGAMKPAPGVKDPEVFRSRRDSYAEGMGHLERVHHDLVAKAEDLKGPVPLSVVFNDYLFGNGFEENMEGDRNRQRPKEPGMK
jgi:hypothetical protein